MKLLLLEIMGLLQMFFIVLYQISWLTLQGTLYDIFIDINFFLNVSFQQLGSIVNFIVMGCLFVSVIFAFYSNLNKFIYFTAISLVLDVFIIFFPFMFFSMDLNRIIPDFYTTPILFSIVTGISILFRFYPNYKEQARIRKEILEIGTKYPYFKLRDVSKKCRVDKNSIISVVKKMIKNDEIYADYFNISKKFVFNEKANLEEIDRLMELYNQWELEKIGKVA